MAALWPINVVHVTKAHQKLGSGVGMCWSRSWGCCSKCFVCCHQLWTTLSVYGYGPSFLSTIWCILYALQPSPSYIYLFPLSIWWWYCIPAQSLLLHAGSGCLVLFHSHCAFRSRFSRSFGLFKIGSGFWGVQQGTFMRFRQFSACFGASVHQICAAQLIHGASTNNVLLTLCLDRDVAAHKTTCTPNAITWSSCLLYLVDMSPPL